MASNSSFNAFLAGKIAADRGAVWLQAATLRDLSDATDKALRELGAGPYDTRAAITCLKAIREYQLRLHRPYAPETLASERAHLAAVVDGRA